MAFGIALQNALDPVFTDKIVAGEHPAPAYQPQKLSKGQLIAGILADALQGAMGHQGQFAPMMERRRAEQDAFERGEQQYSRRQNDELRQRMAILDYQHLHPEPSAMERNLSTWQSWTPEQRQAYQSMQEANGNDFVTMTLPNGQFYAGPKSGIVGALGGITQRPQVGAVVPDPRKAGGPTPSASGGFR